MERLLLDRSLAEANALGGMSSMTKTLRDAGALPCATGWAASGSDLGYSSEPGYLVWYGRGVWKTMVGTYDSAEEALRGFGPLRVLYSTPRQYFGSPAEQREILHMSVHATLDAAPDQGKAVADFLLRLIP